MVLRADWGDGVSFEEVTDIVFNAIKFCLIKGYLVAFDELRYKADPVKQAEFLK